MKDEMIIYPVRNNLNININSCNILSVTHKYTGKTSIEKAFENIAVNHLKSAKRLDLSAVQR